MSNEKVIDEKLKNFISKENAARLWETSVSIAQIEENSSSKKYLVTERGIPSNVLKTLEFRSLKKEVKLLEFKETTCTIEEGSPEKYNSILAGVYGKDGEIIGVHEVKLNDNGSKKSNSNEGSKFYIGEKGETKAAIVQKNPNRTKVYIAEGIETAASIVSISDITGNYTVLASLGVTELLKTLKYVKSNFPPGCTVVLLKDNDEGIDANSNFEKACHGFVNEGFNVVVKQPENKGDDWNDVLKNNSKELANCFNNASPYNDFNCRDDSKTTNNENITKHFVEIKTSLNEVEKNATTVDELKILKNLVENQKLRLKPEISEDKKPARRNPIHTLYLREVEEIQFKSGTNDDLNKELADKLPKLVKCKDKYFLYIKPESTHEDIITLESEEVNAKLSNINFSAGFKKINEKNDVEIYSEIKKHYDFDAEKLIPEKMQEKIKEINGIKTNIKKLYLLAEKVNGIKLDRNENMSDFEKMNEELEKLKKEKNSIIENLPRPEGDTSDYKKSKGEIDVIYNPPINKKIEDCHDLLSKEVKYSIEFLGNMLNKIEDKIEEKTNEANEHKSPYESETLYLKALNESGLDPQEQENLDIWITASLSDYKMGTSILFPHEHENEKGNKTVKIEDSKTNEEEEILKLLKRMLEQPVINENDTLYEKSEDEIIIYSLEIAAELYKSFNVLISGEIDKIQEFDGVMLKNDELTVIERKSNDGTGDLQLQRNFIAQKIKSKSNFFYTVDNSEPIQNIEESKSKLEKKQKSTKYTQQYTSKNKDEPKQGKKDGNVNHDVASDENGELFGFFSEESVDKSDENLQKNAVEDDLKIEFLQKSDNTLGKNEKIIGLKKQRTQIDKESDNLIPRKTVENINEKISIFSNGTNHYEHMENDPQPAQIQIKNDNQIKTQSKNKNLFEVKVAKYNLHLIYIDCEPEKYLKTCKIPTLIIVEKEKEISYYVYGVKEGENKLTKLDDLNIKSLQEHKPSKISISKHQHKEIYNEIGLKNAHTPEYKKSNMLTLELVSLDHYPDTTEKDKLKPNCLISVTENSQTNYYILTEKKEMKLLMSKFPEDLIAEPNSTILISKYKCNQIYSEIKRILPHEYRYNELKNIRESAKNIAIESLEKRNINFVLNKPKNKYEETCTLIRTISYKNLDDVTVSFSTENKGDEKTSNKNTDDALEVLISKINSESKEEKARENSAPKSETKKWGHVIKKVSELSKRIEKEDSSKNTNSTQKWEEIHDKSIDITTSTASTSTTTTTTTMTDDKKTFSK